VRVVLSFGFLSVTGFEVHAAIKKMAKIRVKFFISLIFIYLKYRILAKEIPSKQVIFIETGF
jgi:hypothetical protein